MPVAQSKACNSCAKAKRRCGKQTPACQRCRDKGKTCAYPLSTLGSFVLLEDSSSSSSPQEELLASDASTMTADISIDYNDVDEVLASIPLDCTIYISPTYDINGFAASFLSSETWDIDHTVPSTAATSPSRHDLKRYINQIQDWNTQWVTKGSNPYIHSQLYSGQFPTGLQVAYTALSTYSNRTEANADMIMKIVDDQATKLLLENGVVFDDFGGEIQPGSGNTATLSLVEELARVHALIIYQTICLFDGDIRSRHLAERRFQVLIRWVTQLVESASHRLTQSLLAGDTLLLTQRAHHSNSSHKTNAQRLWETWILAESIRRTWLTSMGLYAAYFILQQGSLLCLGGIRFTNRQGVWEAKTAFAWENECSQSCVGFIQRFEAERFFTESSPSDVDEFGTTMLEITFGTEKMQRWGAVTM
jgi:hypothetical protein